MGETTGMEGPTDSILVNKVLNALTGVLDDGEMAVLVKMMKDAGYIDGSDLSAIETMAKPEPDAMAADSRRSGMALDAHTDGVRRHVIESVNRRFKAYAAGRITQDDLWRPYSAPPLTSAQTQAFDQMFPQGRRLR